MYHHIYELRCCLLSFLEKENLFFQNLRNQSFTQQEFGNNNYDMSVLFTISYFR